MLRVCTVLCVCVCVVIQPSARWSVYRCVAKVYLCEIGTEGRRLHTRRNVFKWGLCASWLPTRTVYCLLSVYRKYTVFYLHLISSVYPYSTLLHAGPARLQQLVVRSGIGAIEVFDIILEPSRNFFFSSPAPHVSTGRRHLDCCD